MEWYLRLIINMFAHYREMGLQTTLSEETQTFLQAQLQSVTRWMKASNFKPNLGLIVTLIYILEKRLQYAYLNKERLSYNKLLQSFIAAYIAACGTTTKMNGGVYFDEFLAQSPTRFSLPNYNKNDLHLFLKDLLIKLDYKIIPHDIAAIIELLRKYAGQQNYQVIEDLLWQSTDMHAVEYGIEWLQSVENPSASLIHSYLNKAATIKHLSALLDYLCARPNLLTNEAFYPIVEAIQKKARDFIFTSSTLRQHQREFLGIFSLDTPSRQNQLYLAQYQAIARIPTCGNNDWDTSIIQGKLKKYAIRYPRDYSNREEENLCEILISLTKCFDRSFSVKARMTLLTLKYLNQLPKGSCLNAFSFVEYYIGCYIRTLNAYRAACGKPAENAQMVLAKLPKKIFGVKLNAKKTEEAAANFLFHHPEIKICFPSSTLDDFMIAELDANSFKEICMNFMFDGSFLDSGTLRLILMRIKIRGLEEALSVISCLESIEQLEQLEGKLTKKEFDFLRDQGKSKMAFFPNESAWEKIQIALGAMRALFTTPDELFSEHESDFSSEASVYSEEASSPSSHPSSSSPPKTT